MTDFISKRFRVFVIVIIAVLAIIIGLSLSGKKGEKRDNDIYFVKNNEIVKYNVSTSESERLTRKFISDRSVEDFYWDWITYNNDNSQGNKLLRLSEDGKVIFYADNSYVCENERLVNNLFTRIDSCDYEFTLYCRSNKPGSEPIRIDNKIIAYYFGDDASEVYAIGIQGGINQYKIDFEKKTVDKEKVVSPKRLSLNGLASAEGVLSFSEDYKTVFWIAEGDLYMKTFDGEARLIDSGVSHIYNSVEGGGNRKYYKTSSGCVYMVDKKGETTCITEECSDFVMLNNNAACYFVSEGYGHNLSEYLDDDIYENDYDTLMWSAELTGDAYEAQIRMWMRRLIAAAECETFSLYYLSGEEGSASVKLDEGILGDCRLSDNINSVTNGLAYSVCSEGKDGALVYLKPEMRKISIMDVYAGIKPTISAYGTFNEISGQNFSPENGNLSATTVSIMLYDLLKKSYVCTVSDGIIKDYGLQDDVFYRNSLKVGSTGDSVGFAINEGSLGYSLRLLEYNGENDITVKSYDDIDSYICGNHSKAVICTESAMEIAGNWISDENVCTGSVIFDDNNGAYYLADCDKYLEVGTFCYIKDGKKVRIDDNVWIYYVYDDGKVVYLKDVDTKYYKGDLYLYDGNSSEIIDSSVNFIMPINSRNLGSVK